jgi:hypothetical protein
MQVMSSGEAQTRRSRVSRIVGRALMWLGVVLFLGSGMLWYQYADTEPKQPRPSVGKVYALDTHGNIVYITHVEQMRLHVLAGAAAVSFVIGVFMAVPIKRSWR